MDLKNLNPPRLPYLLPAPKPNLHPPTANPLDRSKALVEGPGCLELGQQLVGDGLLGLIVEGVDLEHLGLQSVGC